jgi:hypothetical protein
MRRLCTGQTQHEIATELSINEGRLSIICNSPLFKVELAKMERDVRERAIKNIGDVTARIAKLQDPALSVLEDIIINPKEKDISLNLRQKTAVTVLEMAGTKKDKNSEGMSDFAQFISEAYNQAKQRALDKLDSSLAEAVEGSETLSLEEKNSFIDISGDVLAVDDAEDAALASFDISSLQTQDASDSERVSAPHSIKDILNSAPEGTLAHESESSQSDKESKSLGASDPETADTTGGPSTSYTSQLVDRDSAVSRERSSAPKETKPTILQTQSTKTVSDCKPNGSGQKNGSSGSSLSNQITASMKKHGLRAEDILQLLED